jgi:hypothetical protein
MLLPAVAAAAAASSPAGLPACFLEKARSSQRRARPCLLPIASSLVCRDILRARALARVDHKKSLSRRRCSRGAQGCKERERKNKKKKTVFGARTGEDGKKRERGMVAFAVVAGVVVVVVG